MMTPDKVNIWMLVFSGVAVLWAIFTWVVGPRLLSSIVILITDADRNPLTDVALLGGGGVSINTDGRGIVQVPSSWAGKTVSVQQRNGYQVMHTFQILRSSSEIQHVVVPRHGNE